MQETIGPWRKSLDLRVAKDISSECLLLPVSVEHMYYDCSEVFFKGYKQQLKKNMQEKCV